MSGWGPPTGPRAPDRFKPRMSRGQVIGWVICAGLVWGLAAVLLGLVMR